jgi:hypothetical protein
MAMIAMNLVTPKVGAKHELLLDKSSSAAPNENKARGYELSTSVLPGNSKGSSIIVPLTSCLTGLESVLCQLTFFVFICQTD